MTTATMTKAEVAARISQLESRNLAAAKAPPSIPSSDTVVDDEAPGPVDSP